MEAADFQFAHWIGPEPTRPGVISMPYCSLSDVASSFVSMLYEYGWINPKLDWPRWAGTEEALSLRDRPEAIGRANAMQLSKLLTTIVRNDRFCEGALAAAYDSGLIIAVLRRAAMLEAD